jgi:hypothetical protein
MFEEDEVARARGNSLVLIHLIYILLFQSSGNPSILSANTDP